MIGVLQRVRQARVEIQGEVVGAIDHGLLVLVCAQPSDTPATAARFVDKVLKLRVFADQDGRMNRSVVDVGGGLLVVSQFTLAADTRSGNRPGFSGAAPPAQGQALYEHVLRIARERHAPVASGRFGADMQVHLVNDGPVTIPLQVADPD
ncbi:MAG: D-aminoacyl-tRNA deacylase [Rubrivivax sp.]